MILFRPNNTSELCSSETWITSKPQIGIDFAQDYVRALANLLPSSHQQPGSAAEQHIHKLASEAVRFLQVAPSCPVCYRQALALLGLAKAGTVAAGRHCWKDV